MDYGGDLRDHGGTKCYPPCNQFVAVKDSHKTVASEYRQILLEPPLDTWSDLLHTQGFDNARISELRRAARQRLVEKAEAYTLRLSALADDADIELASAGLLTGTPENQPLVMTGHQPVIFHSGLTFKYEVTEQTAAAAGAICVGVVIDTDLGDAGQFSYPEKADDQNHPTLAIESLAQSDNLYLNSRLRPPAELQQIATTVAEQLRTLDRPDSAERVERVLESFAALAATKATASEANLLTRWQHGIGARMLELPLSAIASFPEALSLTADILKQPRRFAAAYNSALEVFRDEHNIRNAANPFPDLKITEATCELPFWIISHNRNRRYALEVQTERNVTRLIADGRTVDTYTGNITAEALEPMLVQNIQLIPRGAMITAFLRLLFADLFVHGTGGGRYDQFTDEFIRTWWNVEPTPFTVASASRYLFPERRDELERLEGIQSSLRELQYNPQRHFGQNVFQPALEAELKDLVQQKDEAVARMKQTHQQGRSARDIGRHIQQITNRIKQAVSTEFESQLQLLTETTAEQQDAIHCRTYPWFLFSDASRLS